MKALWSLAILLAAIVGWYGTEPNPFINSYTLNDISWPNCGQKITTADSGIVGITGGLANRPNPCLSHEAGLYRHLSVYLNTGYPGSKRALKFKNSPKVCPFNDEQCLAYNYGYNSAKYAINRAFSNGIVAKQWWLDVETENSWSDHPVVNRAALQGNFDALAKVIGAQNIGFYSYPGQWNVLTRNWHNFYPAWVATGSTHLDKAVLACYTSSFTGGPLVYSQYTDKLDVDYICH